MIFFIVFSQITKRVTSSKWWSRSGHLLDSGSWFSTQLLSYFLSLERGVNLVVFDKCCKMNIYREYPYKSASIEQITSPPKSATFDKLWYEVFILQHFGKFHSKHVIVVFFSLWTCIFRNKVVFFWTQDSLFQTRPPKNVLLDSGNLDKQINLLGNFSFLSRLDLSENAAADEPDYQLRIIYNLPQVEDLDRKAVKPYVCSNSKLERIFSNF